MITVTYMWFFKSNHKGWFEFSMQTNHFYYKFAFLIELNIDAVTCGILKLSVRKTMSKF